IYAFYQYQSFEREEFTVPLEVKAPGNLTIKNGVTIPQYVRVSIRADRVELSGISSGNIAAYIDLSSVSEEGTHDFLVNVRPDRRLSSIYPVEISVQPQTIRIEVEDEIVRYIPVTATVSGKPAYGYESGSISTEPTSIKFQGPRSAVEGIKEIQTEEVNLDGATEDVSAEVGFLKLSNLAHTDQDAKVTVSVSIIPTVTKKTIPGIEISYDNVPPGLDISKKEHKTMDIVVEGKQLDLDKLNASSFSAWADCSLCTEAGVSYDIPVFVNGGKNVKISSWTVNTVAVVFKEKPYEELWEWEAPQADDN
ncbi:MAG: YbbR-like domain-containing protein, partial [Treponema sp.]|nr:YbbR-like domain-containing protein [Treponema sp.]